MPGPKEQTPDEVQRYLQPIVSDLLRLWKYGIKVPTESQPQGKSTLSFCVHTYSYTVGRLVRVALVAVVSDKPAAHKIGGFASHSHTYYCTDCWISISSKGDVSAFQHGGMWSITFTLPGSP